ncbi:hypothetical protein DEU56DRAFT_900092 [Suillus clintonianus]|uniref:uncharacterized protein n=1 Tax=Suillus clintonianus TaxID=1904413 RepID=UPI001B86E8DB|nr:uncharacterized protein DEU56DRAFT_900092 [Suillus clintonianus]KAG2144623.1 hypothetical protein DEU56DRAFT_900092 [Suillus clintonianus]
MKFTSLTTIIISAVAMTGVAIASEDVNITPLNFPCTGVGLEPHAYAYRPIKRGAQPCVVSITETGSGITVPITKSGSIRHARSDKDVMSPVRCLCESVLFTVYRIAWNNERDTQATGGRRGVWREEFIESGYDDDYRMCNKQFVVTLRPHMLKLKTLVENGGRGDMPALEMGLEAGCGLHRVGCGDERFPKTLRSAAWSIARSRSLAQ